MTKILTFFMFLNNESKTETAVDDSVGTFQFGRYPKLTVPICTVAMLIESSVSSGTDPDTTIRIKL